MTMIFVSEISSVFSLIWGVVEIALCFVFEIHMYTYKMEITRKLCRIATEVTAVGTVRGESNRVHYGMPTRITIELNTVCVPDYNRLDYRICAKITRKSTSVCIQI